MIRSVLIDAYRRAVDGAPARARGRAGLLRSLRDIVEAPLEGQPVWIHLPIPQAQLLSSWLAIPRYCEARRCQGQQRIPTTFHAVIGVPGEPNYTWVACADCTGLMLEGAYAT